MEKDLDLQQNQNQEKEEQVVVAAIPKPKKQKKTKKRLFLLILLLLVTGVMLGTSTYAWFTSNKTVNVNNIQVNVSAANGIQISVDALNWKTVVQTDDITSASYVGALNQMPNILEPVSTVGNVDANGKMEMFLGTVEEVNGNFRLWSSKLTEQHTTDTTIAKFIAFDLYFRVDQPTPVYMNPGSGVSVPGNEADSGIKQASRIAFVILGRSDPGVAYTQTQAITGNASSPAYIWEPNFDIHNLTGIAHALETYNLPNISPTGAAQLAYNGIRAEIPVDSAVELTSTNASYFAAVTPRFVTSAAFSEAAQDVAQFTLITLQPGVTKVRLYMWIEGQDVDCENGASGGQIEFSLQITTEASTTITPTPLPDTP